MRFKTETFTPERAQFVLDNLNVNNYRKVSDAVVRRYALDMANGHWRLTGDPIKYAEDGTLIDGQHRLAACVMAGVPFETAVALDVPIEATDHIDWGRKRSLKDILTRRGEQYAMELAGAIAMSWRWDNDLLMTKQTPSVADALGWLKRNPNISDAVGVARTTWTKLKVPPSVMATFTYRAQQLSPRDEVQFRHLLLGGAGLEEGDPILVLRRWLLSGTASQRWSRPDSVTFLAMLIKAWNNYLLGRPTRSLTWRRDGYNREPFPVMVGREGEETEQAS